MAVTETIQELLELISESQYGRDMRDAIRKGIQKCYEEGSAGETDLVARQAIEEIESDMGALGEWYELPATVVTKTNVTTTYYMAINPALKLLNLTLTVHFDAAFESYGVSAVLTDMPILKPLAVPTERSHQSSRSFALQQTAATNPSATDITAYPITASIGNYTDAGRTDRGEMTHSRVIISDPVKANTTYVGSIMVPYTDCSAAHPFSEASVIA